MRLRLTTTDRPLQVQQDFRCGRLFWRRSLSAAFQSTCQHPCEETGRVPKISECMHSGGFARSSFPGYPTVLELLHI